MVSVKFLNAFIKDMPRNKPDNLAKNILALVHRGGWSGIIHNHTSSPFKSLKNISGLLALHSDIFNEKSLG